MSVMACGPIAPTAYLTTTMKIRWEWTNAQILAQSIENGDKTIIINGLFYRLHDEATDTKPTWKCACGQENLAWAEKCNKCGAEHTKTTQKKP